MTKESFEKEVIDRLARIETKQDAAGKTIEEHSKTLKDHGEAIVKVDASTRSAHHRIDGFLVTAGAFGAMAGAAIQWISALVSLFRGGGHS